MDPENGEGRKSHHALATATEKIYMAIAATEATVVCAIAFTVFGLIEQNIQEQNAKVRTVPVYLVIFIMAQLFSLLYVFDALRARNIVQLLLHMSFQACILLYAIVEIPQTKDALEGTADGARCGNYVRCFGPDSLYNQLQKLMVVPPIIIGLCTFAYIPLLYRLYKEFGWAVFHIVGASPEMKRMHREYQTLISLLKLLLFYSLAFCISTLILATADVSSTAQLVITIIALPVSLFTVLGCGWALTRENKPVMGASIFFMVLGIAFFLYKLISMWLPGQDQIFTDTKITQAVFSVFAILILILSTIFGCLCFANFDKGLLQAHQNPENRTSLWALPEQVQFKEKSQDKVEEDAPAVNRIVID